MERNKGRIKGIEVHRVLAYSLKDILTLHPMASSDKKKEKLIRVLTKAAGEKGLEVRREHLSRGNSYRCKSGSCRVFGEKVFFLDRNLSLPQQESLLFELFDEQNIKFQLEQFRGLESDEVTSLRRFIEPPLKEA